MSAHELTVLWPAYFAYKKREADRAEAEAEEKRRSRRFQR